MFKRTTIALLVFAISLMGMPTISVASTDISGSVTGLIWTPEGSPYIVSGDFEVAQGATLTIKPGTMVRLEEGSKIIVKGKIVAEGTESDRIIFTANNSNPKRGDWGEIIFESMANDESIIKNADIKYGSGIICDDSSPILTNILFLNNSIGIKLSGDNAIEGKRIEIGEVSTSNNSGLETMIIENNEFTDNGIGVEVNRNNSNDYISTPGGNIYQGDIKITSIIKDNVFLTNGEAIIIIKGDNNLVKENEINNNYREAMIISSSANIVEKNTIKNNYSGLKIDGSDTIVLQNTISNNTENGLILSDLSAIIKNNNIYKNDTYNLINSAGIIDISDNYWGSSYNSEVSSKINNEVGVVSYNPVKSSYININSLSSPILKELITTTNSSIQPISGYKTTGSAVYADGVVVIPANDKATWEYNMNLEIGVNKDKIYLKNSNGVESSSVSVSISRDEIVVISEPAVNYELDTTKGSQTINGSKMGGTGIWINNSEVIAPSGHTTWSFELGLAMGENNYSIFAQDSSNRRSQSINITINRKGVDVSEVIEDERSLSTEIDEDLSKRLAGKLLIQVERSGLIWYVNPNDNKRYYITWDNALELFKAFSIGISEENLAKLPLKDSGEEGDSELRERLKGNFLLRVENNGMISYIDLDGYRHDIEQDDLMNIFRNLSLGISNTNIRKIEVGEIR